MMVVSIHTDQKDGLVSSILHYKLLSSQSIRTSDIRHSMIEYYNKCNALYMSFFDTKSCNSVQIFMVLLQQVRENPTSRMCVDCWTYRERYAAGTKGGDELRDQK